MASKTVYPFGTNGESTGGISKVVEYNCKAEMFLDNTKPIGTIAKLTDVYRYRNCRKTHSSEQVYGIMIQEGSLTYYGTCLISTTSNNSIFIENSNGVIKIKDTINGFYEVIDTTSTYLLDGDIYNLIKDGDFVRNNSVPNNDYVLYKVKKGTGRITYYVYNGHGWNVLKNTDLTKPLKLRVVHHCIPFGAKPGYLYVGKITKPEIYQWYGGRLEDTYCSAMKFKNVAGKTIDLSKLGTDHFIISSRTSDYYSIDTTAQTITFTDEYDDYWVFLKNPFNDKIRFGYYIDYDGKLRRFVDNNGTIETEECTLTPITLYDDFLRCIHFTFRPENFKNKDLPTSIAIPYIYTHGGLELLVLETNTLTHRIKHKCLRRATKWIRARYMYPRHGGVRNLSRGEVDDLGWGLLRIPKVGRNNGTSFCGIVRIRRTNKRHTIFSEWTYWKLYFIYNGRVNGEPNIVNKRAIRLEEVYHKRY